MLCAIGVTNPDSYYLLAPRSVRTLPDHGARFPELIGREAREQIQAAIPRCPCGDRLLGGRLKSIAYSRLIADEQRHAWRTKAVTVRGKELGDQCGAPFPAEALGVFRHALVCAAGIDGQRSPRRIGMISGWPGVRGVGPEQRALHDEERACLYLGPQMRGRWSGLFSGLSRRNA